MKIDYKCVYIANDGTEFDDEAECRKYEESLMPEFKGFMLDYDGKPTKDYDEAYIVEFTCSEDFISFLKQSGACTDGLTNDSSVGIYLYSDRDDCWYLATPYVQRALIRMLNRST